VGCDTYGFSAMYFANPCFSGYLLPWTSEFGWLCLLGISCLGRGLDDLGPPFAKEMACPIKFCDLQSLSGQHRFSLTSNGIVQGSGIKEWYCSK